MVICPSCLNEVPEKKFCEQCGTPLKSQAASPSKQTPAPPQVAQTEPVGEKECPVCRQYYLDDANYCKDCRYEGKPVSLVDKGSVVSVTIKLTDIETGKSSEFMITTTKQFGRIDFKQWQEDGGITNDEWSHISKKHFKIDIKNGVYKITDTKSANGTYLNDKKLASEVTTDLQNGAEIGLPMGGGNIKNFTVEIK